MPYFSTVKAFLLCPALLLLTWSVGAAVPLPLPDDPQAVAGWFSELGSRREGSPEENRVFEALNTWFAARAAVETDGFGGMEGEHSFSKRLWFRVPGPKPGEVVVAAPTDGANDRGLAWAVAWADEALRRGTPVTLIFLFTGAERGAGPQAGLGSRAFLQDYYPTVPAALLYLDAPGPRVKLTAESGLLPSPLWMVRGLTESLAEHGLEAEFTGTAPSLFRLDLPERRNALAPWLDRSIPGLLVAGGPASIPMVRSLESFVAGMEGGVPSHWDRHYLAFDFGFWKFFWSQQIYLIVFLSVAGMLIFGYAVAGRGRRGSLRTLRKGFWQLPVLFAFLFLALYTGTELTRFLQDIRGEPDLWKAVPLGVWLFKAMVAVTLYLSLFLPFRRSPLSRDPDFYGQAALLWLGLLTMASAALELSFSFYFLWALGWCAVLVAVPWRWAKLVALLAGPVWLAKAAWDVLGPQPDLVLAEWALHSPLAGNLALSVLLFPFLLQLASRHFSAVAHQNRDEGLRAWVQLGIFAVATLFAGVAVLRIPATIGATQPPALVHLDETPRPELWKTTVSRSGFLDRIVWSVRFEGEIAPGAVEMTLRSENVLTVFDCTFPFTLDAEGKEARIVIGREPPLPLNLRLTLPKTTEARLEVKVHLGGTAPDLVGSVGLVP